MPELKKIPTPEEYFENKIPSPEEYFKSSKLVKKKEDFSVLGEGELYLPVDIEPQRQEIKPEDYEAGYQYLPEEKKEKEAFLSDFAETLGGAILKTPETLRQSGEFIQRTTTGDLKESLIASGKSEKTAQNITDAISLLNPVTIVLRTVFSQGNLYRSQENFRFRSNQQRARFYRKPGIKQTG